MLDNMHQKWAVIFSDLCVETAKTSGYSNGFSQISKDQLRWSMCLDGMTEKVIKFQATGIHGEKKKKKQKIARIAYAWTIEIQSWGMPTNA